MHPRDREAEVPPTGAVKAGIISTAAS